jgi:PIN domain nuclease of toxin-antitoxin system
MSAVLLDTNALIWFMANGRMKPAALEAIAAAQTAGGVFISPISAWEAGLALMKRHGRPDLGGLDIALWFRNALKLPGARLVVPSQRIAIEAAKMPGVLGRGDPGDCFLIATARIKKVPIVTRDRHMQRLAARRPEYLDVIAC